MVFLVGIRVITLGSTFQDNLANLTQGHQLPESVVDGCPTDLGEDRCCSRVNLIRREVDMRTRENLSHHPPLRREAPFFLA